ncbi:hypothetical protein I8Y06_001678 [Photobacterium damselae]|nr:hypothetical protein [Photobacterium damselae]
MNKLLNFCGFALLVVSVFLFGLNAQSVEMGIAVAASGIFLAFANLDKFTRFKGAGFEAELKSVVQEANASIEQLKSVATPLAISSLQAMTKGNRWSDGTRITREENDSFSINHDLFDDLCQLIETNKLSNEKLELLKKQYVNIHAWDMVEDIIYGCKGNMKDIVGISSFEHAPDLEALNEYIKAQNLSQEMSEKASILRAYYKKYEL